MLKNKNKILILLLSLFVLVSSFNFAFAEGTQEKSRVLSDYVTIKFLKNGDAKITHNLMLKKDGLPLSKLVVPIKTNNEETEIRDLTINYLDQSLDILKEDIKKKNINIPEHSFNPESPNYIISYTLTKAISKTKDNSMAFLFSLYDNKNEDLNIEKYKPEETSLFIDYSDLNLKTNPSFIGFNFNTRFIEESPSYLISDKIKINKPIYLFAQILANDISLPYKLKTIEKTTINDLYEDSKGICTISEDKNKDIDVLDNTSKDKNKELENLNEESSFDKEKAPEEKDNENPLEENGENSIKKDDNWTDGIFSNIELESARKRAEEKPSSRDKIYEINTKVFPKKDGNILVEQLWTVNNASGTEWYIPMQSVGTKQIKNFKVSSDGKNFKDMGTNWNIDENFENKAFKFGINIRNSYPEICFGKSKMGTITYKISYELQDIFFISKDNIPYIYSRFINDNMNPKPQHLKFELDASDTQSTDIKIWGFGFRGEIESTDTGYKVNSLDGKDLDHMTFLIALNNIDPKFLKQSNKNFDEIKDEAFSGSDYELDSSSNEESGQMIKAIFYVLFFLFSVSTMTAPIRRELKNMRKQNTPTNIKDIKIDKDFYFRDIPLEENLSFIYIFSQMNMGLIQKLDTKFMSAFILSWIKNKNVEIIQGKSTFFKKDDNRLKFIKEPKFKSNLEIATWSILNLAAGADHILSPKELKNYAEDHDESIKYKIEEAEKEDRRELLRKKYTEVDHRKHKRFFLTEKGIKEYKNLFGLKNFLDNFTIINEREVKEVELWDNYLIVATIFGTSSKVLREFKELIPNYIFAREIITDNNKEFLDNTDYLFFIDSFDKNMAAGISSAQSSRSSGSGGSSSFGGGFSGFSGGGSGGGSR